jgi:protein gp37
VADTTIEWTDATWNPTTGCDRVSPGCDNCYALTLAKRLKGMGSAKYQTDGDPRTSGPGFGLAMHDDALDLPLRWRKPKRVFVNSMSDLFHPKVTDEFIARAFAVMALAGRHTFQVLTKRAPRMASLISRPDFLAAVAEHATALIFEQGAVNTSPLSTWTCNPNPDGSNLDEWVPPWPLPNVWLGVSVEDQQRADERVPRLLQTPAAVRFLSCEPLLGPIDLHAHDDGLHHWLPDYGPDYDDGSGEPVCQAHGISECRQGRSFIDWVVTGGESGPGFRHVDLDWFRAIRDQCDAAGVAYLHKQNGGRYPKANGRRLDGATHDGYPEVARAA